MSEIINRVGVVIVSENGGRRLGSDCENIGDLQELAGNAMKNFDKASAAIFYRCMKDVRETCLMNVLDEETGQKKPDENAVFCDPSLNRDCITTIALDEVSEVLGCTIEDINEVLFNILRINSQVSQN